MERLFYKKSVSILFVALAVVLIFLLCMLLINLTQLSGLRATAAELEKMVEAAQNDDAALQELKEYKNSNQYVVEWAIQTEGLVSKEDIIWIRENVDNK